MNLPARHPLRTALTTAILLEGRFQDSTRWSLPGKATLYADRVELKQWAGWRWKCERISLAEFRKAEWSAYGGRATEVKLMDGQRHLRFEEPERWQRMIDAALRASRAPIASMRSNSTLLFA